MALVELTLASTKAIKSVKQAPGYEYSHKKLPLWRQVFRNVLFENKKSKIFSNFWLLQIV
jgi:hypothetical protein